MPKITLNNVTVSDAYMTLLADRGIDYWFANAGTDFAPVVETLAKAEVLETKVPKPVTCPHENTAMHMAIGYFLATGKPQAVMVHVNVGTANGMNGLLNAARGHVPVLFTAGRTPTNQDGLAGHRSLDIHWTQEMFDQAGMLRESVKWDYELRNGLQLETVVDRALTIAKSEPMGPVYLSLPRLRCWRRRWRNLLTRRRRAKMPLLRRFPTVKQSNSWRRCWLLPRIRSSSPARPVEILEPGRH